MLESDLQKLSVTGLVTLYELDATKLGAGIMRWHGHVSFEDWQKVIAWAGREDQLIGNTDENVGREYWAGDGEIEVKRDLIWQGQIYNPIPIQSDGLEMRGDGRASTPSLVIANNLNGLQGAISAYMVVIAVKSVVIQVRQCLLKMAHQPTIHQRINAALV